MSGVVRLERDGHVATLVLDHPGKRNALSRAMWLAIPELLAPLVADDGIGVLMVRGTGMDFSAGADISEFGETFATPESARAYMADFGAAQEAVANFPKPTIALIRGACVGGGCGLAIACDLRFAEPGARLGITPTKLGMIYSWNDTRRLVAAVGPACAADMLYSARLLGGAEALAVRLVNRLIDADTIEADVADYARRIARQAPMALAATKRVLSLIRSADDGAAEADCLFFAAVDSTEFAEGRDAFLAGRAPDFRSLSSR